MAIVISAVLVGLFVAGMQLVENETARRVFQLLGGNMPGGIIQFLSFMIFFWGFFEINDRSRRLKVERNSIQMGLLPEKEHWVLSPTDVNDLKLKMINAEKEEKTLLTSVIKKACTKFRANNSISDVIDVVTNQIKINSNKAEGGQSIIRFLAWALPSVGFIGTIMGIAQALGLADKASDPAVLGQITDAMYVAFDTTLVALLLNIFLMWFYHNLQETEDELHSDMEEYVMENLVNRIHLE